MANRRPAGAAAAVGDGQAAAPQVIVMAPQVQVGTFYGTMDDDGLLVEEFTTQLRALWRSCQMSKEQQLGSINQYSGPDVRLEIRNLPEATRNDPQRILDELIKIFGDSRHPHELARNFYGHRQRPAETVQLYANRLQRAFEKLVRREVALGEPETPVVRLRQQFIAGLRDPSLQGTLGDKVSTNPDLTFVDVRKVAINWASYRSAGCSDDSSARAAAVVPQPDSSAELVSLRAEVAALTRLVEEGLRVRQSESPGLRQSGPSEVRTCYYCNKPGHLRKDCRKRIRDESKSETPRQAQGNE